MGCSVARARGSIRFSLGIYNTQGEVDYALEHLPGIIAKLRGNKRTTLLIRFNHQHGVAQAANDAVAWREIASVGHDS